MAGDYSERSGIFRVFQHGYAAIVTPVTSAQVVNA
jgi:hypothetical protein